ncbi:VOC family protein [Acaryochloris marina]|uniref:Glyoxalase/bleomycin resistance protein/dioxygenase n=1 Tax=Acaryochloris marina (strain MBIC 11017) TaxID=329726 RepID=A8ZM25_ACAM1|nr:VOC family protein [Acaryochloris marina]ABW31794.1 glyoxalase/bleomycin resistance protein/dioxygenase [Acaryochloris marina MBIC11017]BDM83015.1 VOC family protein [Acaryochloris marina MBIC10699]
MQLNPYLFFNGQCQSAFQFYEQCLGGKVETIMPYEGSPMEDQVPPEWRNKVMHAELTVNNRVLMGSDGMPGEYEVPKGFSVSLNMDDPAKAEQIFQALAENGTVSMPIQETFWAIRFGMVTDQFSIPWLINCDKPA